jgi:hypothetical protein
VPPARPPRPDNAPAVGVYREPGKVAHDETERSQAWVVGLDDAEDDLMLSTRELIEQVRSGRLGGNTFVWREGMKNWRPIAQIPELAGYVARGGYATTGGFLGTGLELRLDEDKRPASEVERGGRVKVKPVALSRGLLFRPDAAPDAAPGSAKAPTPANAEPESRLGTQEDAVMPPPSLGLADEHEETEVIGLDLKSAAESAPPSAPAAGPKPPARPRQPPPLEPAAPPVRTANSDEPMVIDVEVEAAPPHPSSPSPETAPSRAVPDHLEASPGNEASSAGGGDASRSAGGRRVRSSRPEPIAVERSAAELEVRKALAERRQERGQGLGGLGRVAAALAVLAVGMVWLAREQSKSLLGSEPAPSLAEAESVRAGSPPPGVQRSEPDEPLAHQAPSNDRRADDGRGARHFPEAVRAPPPQAAAVPGSARQRAGPAEPRPPGDDHEPEPARSRPPEPVDAEAAPKPSELVQPEEQPRRAEPAGPFDKEEARLALTEASGRASVCRKEGDPSGVARVSLTFASSGRVTSANVAGPPFAGTATGGCIAAVLRGVRVSPFQGDHVTVTKTVVIQ